MRRFPPNFSGGNDVGGKSSTSIAGAFVAIASVLLAVTIASPARAASFTVTNLNTAGPGSLPDTIAAANGAAGANTIQFASGLAGTINLTSTLPAITSALTIAGPTGSLGITISGGGAVQLMQVNAGATLNLQFLTLANGSVTGIFGSNGEGGGIFNSGTVTVTNSTFSANQATGGATGVGNGGEGHGGAIFNDGVLTASNSTFSANQVTGGATSDGNGAGGVGLGGAIFNQGTVTVINSSFSGNQALGGDSIAVSRFGGGGAIFDGNASAVLSVTNCTFSSNLAAFGGAILNFNGAASFKGSILAASAGSNCVVVTAVTDAGYNISDDNSCGFSTTSSKNNTDPRFAIAGLASNGGPTQTIALHPSSPAIDAIPFTSCTDQTTPTPSQLTTDQRGMPRPDSNDNHAACDVGAYESGKHQDD
ncbi:MAG: hypothetical protein QOG61_2586 [Candidatus Binataceae bacterium]|nr:hypothetical protein [Candidatus Binataceae bacterium]